MKDIWELMTEVVRSCLEEVRSSPSTQPPPLKTLAQILLFVIFWFYWVFIVTHRLCSLVAVPGLLVVASPVAVHGLCSTGSSVVAPRHVESSQPGIKPLSPALTSRFLTTGAPGKSQTQIFLLSPSKPWIADHCQFPQPHLTPVASLATLLYLDSPSSFLPQGLCTHSPHPPVSWMFLLPQLKCPFRGGLPSHVL